MNSKDIYKNKFKELLQAEEQARDLYKYYIQRIKDPALLEKIKEIYADEEKHVRIVQNIIELTFLE